MSKLVTKIYNNIALLSPRIEVKLRQLYWNNNERLYRYNPNVHTLKKSDNENIEKINFDDILEQLKQWGVKEGSLLIVHSSFDSLKNTGLSPIEIINKLRGLIGQSGTLAMPVIRKYKNEPASIEMIKDTYTPPKCIYNVRKTPVISGLLPTILMRFPEAQISLHPLNTMCAVGPLAKDMMKRNIDGDAPSPHGQFSSWKFCVDHDAIVISLGTDLRHHNTIGHVAEEAYGDWYWSDEEWYNLREFSIEKVAADPIELVVKERKPLWGMLHQAELNRYNDLIKNNIIKSRSFGQVLLELEYSRDLICFLRSKNKQGYPYYK